MPNSSNKAGKEKKLILIRGETVETQRDLFAL
jgi:hypothetical protein